MLQAVALSAPWNARPLFVCATLAQGVLFVAAARFATQGRLALILAVAAALRVAPVVEPTLWSDDIYRYVWDGEVQQAGINPYRYFPSDPALAPLRDDAVYPFINRRDTARTIYPPFAQMVFAAVAGVQPSVRAMKVAMVLAEAAGIWGLVLLLRRTGRPASRVLLYAWHPLPLLEIAYSGHVDALIVAVVPFVLLASVSGRRALTGLALSAATLTKFFPLVIGPAVWRRWDWRMPAAFLAATAAFYVPYLSVGAGVFGYLGGYTAEENLRGTDAETGNSGFWFVDALHAVTGWDPPALAYPALAACVLGALAIAAMLRRPGTDATLAWSRALALATMTAMTPHYAWYFVWPLALLAAAPWWPGFWPSLAAPLLYWSPLNGRVPLWAGLVIYGGFAVLIMGDALRRRLRPTIEGADMDSLPPTDSVKTLNPRRYFEAVDTSRTGIADHAPVCMYLEVTNRCNLLCETCPRTFEDLEPPADMSWELFTRIVDQAPDVKRVVLHGVGEPMLVKALPKMVAYLKARGTYVLFNTNGTLLNARNGRQLAQAGLDELRVSLDAADAKSFMAVRGKDYFARIVRNVREFTAMQREEGLTTPRVSLWLTGLRETIDQLPEFIRLSSSIGVNEVHLQRLVFFPDGQGLARADQALFESIEGEEADKLREAQVLAASLGMMFDASGATEPGESLKRQDENQPWSLCRRPWSLMYFTAHGRAIPCCIAPFSMRGYDQFTLGDASQETLRAIWNGPAYQDFRNALLSDKPPSACANCGLRWSL